MEKIDPGKAYLPLESGPIVLVTTHHGDHANIMRMGFHMVMQHAPPLIGCIIGPWDYSYKALKETGECVIAIPTVDLAREVVKIGNCTGAETDKFAKFKLTPKKASKVGAPLIAECLANIECRVADATLAGKYNFFILEAVAIWIDRTRKERRLLHHNGDGTFTIDGRRLDLRDLMVQWNSFRCRFKLFGSDRF